MTKKDYVMIASALKCLSPIKYDDDLPGGGYSDAHRTWKDCVTGIADAMAADNGRFDRARFYDACDYKPS
jgi:hypothetical protein